MVVKFTDEGENQEKVAIVIVGYNRLESVKRLLSSLESSHYPAVDIPLVISIDASGNEELYSYVRSYKWPFGAKHVFIHENRLGLREHIFWCGDLVKHFKGIILLEDDLFVSPYFYEYATECLEYYDNDPLAAGIGLYSYQSNIYSSLPFQPYQSFYDVYGTQATVTWGEAWTKRMWLEFRQWMSDNPDIDWASLDIAPSIKKFKRAWSKFFSAYLSVTGRFVVAPYKSYTTNFSESGEHNSTVSPVAQVPIVNRKETLIYAPVAKLVCYDSFFNPVDDGFAANIPAPINDVCVDLYDNHPNIRECRYLLTLDILPFKCLQSYALSLRPIDSNVRNNIGGKGIYLYDRTIRVKGKTDRQPVQSIVYRLVMFRGSLLMKYLKQAILIKLRNTLHV